MFFDNPELVMKHLFYGLSHIVTCAILTAKEAGTMHHALLSALIFTSLADIDAIRDRMHSSDAEP